MIAGSLRMTQDARRMKHQIDRELEIGKLFLKIQQMTTKTTESIKSSSGKAESRLGLMAVLDLRDLYVGVRFLWTFPCVALNPFSWCLRLLGHKGC